jgi:hypothetical protein
MKILKTARYEKISSDKGLGNMFGDMSGGQGAFGVKKKYAEYAQLVMDLINQGVPQQEAFDRIMAEKQITKSAQVFRQGVIDAIKELYNQQSPQQPAFEKSYDQQYSDTTLPPQRQIPAY